VENLFFTKYLKEEFPIDEIMIGSLLLRSGNYFQYTLSGVEKNALYSFSFSREFTN